MEHPGPKGFFLRVGVLGTSSSTPARLPLQVHAPRGTLEHMSEGSSIIDLGELSKPATVLIEKISDALGGYFKPYQIKRVAKAEGEAEIIRAQTQVDVTDLQRRAMIRFVAEEGRKQENIETITAKAIPQLEESAKPDKVQEDWIANFFDKCRIVSDEEMQTLWSRVLAGEANAPGTFSKQTVNLLGSLDQDDARVFTALCGFGWFFGEVAPLIFDVNASIYNEAGIDFASVTHLDDIGLVNFQPIGGFRRFKFPKQIVIYYFGRPVIAEFKQQQNSEIDTGKVLLTKAGQEFARICGAEPVEGFMDFVVDHWAKLGLVLSSPYPRKRQELSILDVGIAAGWSC